VWPAFSLPTERRDHSKPHVRHAREAFKRRAHKAIMRGGNPPFAHTRHERFERRTSISIRADLLRRILSRGVQGPAENGGPTHSNWKCLGTSAYTLADEHKALPAIAAITAIATISSAPTPVTPAPPSSSAATAAKTATAAASLCLGTRFVDHQVSPAEILPVQGINRPVRVLVVGYFDESKSARLARETVTNEVDTRRGNTHLRKPLLKLIFRCRKRKITDIELLHL